jgi:hypothetical protein
MSMRRRRGAAPQLRVLVDALAANGPLRLGPAPSKTVWALTSPELHKPLVRRRDTDWLARNLEALLLPD